MRARLFLLAVLLLPFLLLLSFLLLLPFLLHVDSALEAQPKPEPKNSWITFLSHRSGENLLYRMRPDGTECKPIFGAPIKDPPRSGAGPTLYQEPHCTRHTAARNAFAS